MQKITILLAEDHTIVRQGFRLLLEAEADITIVGEAANGRQAVQLVKKLRPNIVIMDIAMPQLNGLEATRQIVRDCPSTRVLVLSCYSDDEYVNQLTEAGAAGYLLKQTAAADLIKAIREAKQGNAFFSPAISKRLIERYRETLLKGFPVKKEIDLLTSRQVEVLQLVAEGRPNKQIAAELNVSVKTVQNHRQQLMKKLDIHETAGLTRYAISKGIVKMSTADSLAA